uniref:Pre-rRNA-processing protein TSR2 homolog n=1 Tax=Timema shepardi TaxID=629360 RepID=A0A7R9B1S2_TIMSH|nr:unnamed protein product [Timema shepardi]
METCDIYLVKQEIVEIIKTEPQNEDEFDVFGQSGIKTEDESDTSNSVDEIVKNEIKLFDSSFGIMDTNIDHFTPVDKSEVKMNEDILERAVKSVFNNWEALKVDQWLIALIQTRLGGVVGKRACRVEARPLRTGRSRYIDLVAQLLTDILTLWSNSRQMAANLRFSGAESLSRATNFVEVVVAMINNTGMNVLEKKNSSYNLCSAVSVVIREGVVFVTAGFVCDDTDCDYYDLLDLLEDTMDEQFDTYIEDGSLEEVATLLKSFHDSFKSGNTEQLLQDINSQPDCEQWLLARSGQTGCTYHYRTHMFQADDATDESCAMETCDEVAHTSSLAAVSPRQDPAEDGWTQVARRKK